MAAMVSQGRNRTDIKFVFAFISRGVVRSVLRDKTEIAAKERKERKENLTQSREEKPNRRWTQIYADKNRNLTEGRKGHEGKTFDRHGSTFVAFVALVCNNSVSVFPLRLGGEVLRGL